MGMWFLISSRRLFYSSVVVLLMLSVLQIWVFCDCRAGAIRVLPGNYGMMTTRKMTESSRQGMNIDDDDKGKADLFRKYFKGRSFSFNKTDDRGLKDAKRRVPSCPDPLHN